MIKEYFTLPFVIGTCYLLFIVLYRFIKWTIGLSKIDKIRIRKNIFTRSTLISVKEAFMEGLLHRKIFRKNRVLGYMHMSLAFGWFLLIVIGHLETTAYKKSLSFPFYHSVFFKYFVAGHESFFLSGFFTFMMDLLLIFVLSGLTLALIKRFKSRIYGMQKTTRLKSGDKIALISLWFIFPLRFLAESFSAGTYHNGGFFTQFSGRFFSSFLPVETLLDPTWLTYSLSLGFFFIALPNSRYMHIPAEIFYIFLRNYGIKLKKRCNSFTQVQVYSCSRCGICLDTCQMSDANIKTTQSVYVLKHIRNKNLTDETLFNCLLCGKCQQVCPVGIELIDLRITQRIETTLQYNSSYDYLRDGVAQKADVVYFAGCMTHLTPGIKKAIIELFKFANINYWFLDESKAPCCGRPLMQAGQFEAARKLILNNQRLIYSARPTTLVVSCPICYKVFREDYKLPGIEIKHHSEFFLELITNQRLPIVHLNQKVIYHDPCELGRGCGIYDEPRELLQHFVQIISIKNEKEQSLCCGGSLGNIKINQHEREKIRNMTIQEFLAYEPDALVTACPLCKKTFQNKGNELVVYDLAEILYHALQKTRAMMNYSNHKQTTYSPSFEEVNDVSKS